MSVQGRVWYSARDLKLHPLECARRFADAYGAEEFWLSRHRMLGGASVVPLYLDWKDRLRSWLGVRKHCQYTTIDDPFTIGHKEAKWDEVKRSWMEPMVLHLVPRTEHWREIEHEIRDSFPQAVRDTAIRIAGDVDARVCFS